ncbi:hypothetical protein SUDANB105_07540 [Streptomyces sp. enrichment culture]
MGRSKLTYQFRNPPLIQMALTLTHAAGREDTRRRGLADRFRQLVYGTAPSATLSGPGIVHLSRRQRVYAFVIDRREPLLALAQKADKAGYIDHCTAVRPVPPWSTDSESVACAITEYRGRDPAGPGVPPYTAAASPADVRRELRAACSGCSGGAA